MNDPRRAEVTIEALTEPLIPETIAVLARAFWPDPLFGFFARDRLAEHHQLAQVFSAFLADAAPYEHCSVAVAAGRVIGAAVWLSPGQMPRSATREVKLQARVARLLITGRNRRAGLALLTAVDKVHPAEPHWYLNLLGADPLVQGKGVGGQLLLPVLTRADTEGMPCYLETQKESNLAFYGRHGFEVRDEIRLPASPPVWAMWRPAR